MVTPDSREAGNPGHLYRMKDDDDDDEKMSVTNARKFEYISELLLVEGEGKHVKFFLQSQYVRIIQSGINER